jgi:hypothetical protein
LALVSMDGHLALGRLASPVPGWIVVDLDRVTGVDAVAGAMLGATLAALFGHGHRLSIVGETWPAPGTDPGWTWQKCPSLGEAIAWGEDGLLDETNPLKPNARLKWPGHANVTLRTYSAIDA